MDQMVQPHVRELFLHGILAQPGREVGEIHTVHFLILVETGEDDSRPVAGSSVSAGTGRRLPS